MLDYRPVLEKTEDYLSRHITNFKSDHKKGKSRMMTCPFCRDERGTMTLLPGTLHKLKCQMLECPKRNVMVNLFDIVRHVEKDKKNNSDDQLARYIAKAFNVKLEEKYLGEQYLDYYEQQGFDLVPVARNQKIPIEKDWTNKTHKNKAEWLEWLDNGLNIGVKTGKVSNIVVLDVDQKPIPLEIDALKGTTLVQETLKGFHLFYQYDADLPKCRIDDFKLDLENDGGQVVITPSIVEGQKRSIVELVPISPLPKALKELLQSKLSNKKKMLTTPSPNIETDFSDITHGKRNRSLISIGGILRKKLNVQQTAYVLDFINKNFVNPPLNGSEVHTIVSSLDKYIGFDEQDLAEKVLNYLKLVGEAYAKDVQEALVEPKQLIDKTLAYLTTQGKIIRHRRSYRPVTRVDWKDTFMKEGEPIDFKMPYFDEHVTFRWADMILIGGQQKVGKSHIALNIIKQLVDQKLKPYYITTESGNRFATIAMQLGLKEGDFYWSVYPDPGQIELEPGKHVTIIDWLLPKDYAETDKLYQRFVDQLVKSGGILIVFAQLRHDNSFFAKDMVAMFPALVSKYVLEADSTGEYGAFHLDYIREPKFGGKRALIPCRYDRITKLLSIVAQQTALEPVPIKV